MSTLDCQTADRSVETLLKAIKESPPFSIFELESDLFPNGTFWIQFRFNTKVGTALVTVAPVGRKTLIVKVKPVNLILNTPNEAVQCDTTFLDMAARHFAHFECDIHPWEFPASFCISVPKTDLLRNIVDMTTTFCDAHCCASTEAVRRGYRRHIRKGWTPSGNRNRSMALIDLWISGRETIPKSHPDYSWWVAVVDIPRDVFGLVVNMISFV